MLFIRGLIIPSAQGPQPFEQCVQGFQQEFFNDVAPSLHAVRDGLLPPLQRFWMERTKKASKDSDIAICLLWLTAFAKRPTYFQVGAVDRGQAAIVKKRIEALLYWNPWLNDYVEVQLYKVKHKGGLAVLDILAAERGGSHGENPDLLVLNEVSHVTMWEFIENLLDNATGVPMGMVIVATNAGFKGSKTEVLRDIAVKSPDWRMYIWDKPAPWMDRSKLEEARQRNTPTRFKRLYYGRWASGKGDALDESDIDRCFANDRGPVLEPEKGWQYIAGLDLGVSHDHSGLVVLGVNPIEQRLRVAQYRNWAPSKKTGEVDLIEVENVCKAVSKMFGIGWFGYDPSQAKLMSQRLARDNVSMREVSFASPKNLTEMAQGLIQVTEAGKLECYDDGSGVLRRDFGKFNIVEKLHGGYKLEAVSDEYGHADVGTALVICLPRALKMLSGGIGSLLPDDDIGWNDDEPLTKEELEEMPDDLKEIYDAYDDMEKEHKKGWDRDAFLEAF